MRDKIKLVSSAGTGHFYTTDKNKRSTPSKLEFKKYERYLGIQLFFNFIIATAWFEFISGEPSGTKVQRPMVPAMVIKTSPELILERFKNSWVFFEINLVLVNSSLFRKTFSALKKGIPEGVNSYP